MMDKQTKSHYLLKGMFAEFQMKPQARLLNKMVGIKFKQIRLEKLIKIQNDLLNFEKIYQTIVSLFDLMI